MSNRIERVRYRRKSEQCRSCRQPIDHDPTTDGCYYGWSPEAGRCYSCWTVDLFGATMQPSEEWYRRVRKLVMASWGVVEACVPDGPSESPSF